VWREPNQWMMILMGCDAKDLPQVGLLSSTDGLRWTLLPQRPASQQPSK
jgi:sucrose-6-phosphate hydrolase SacC (GH32 family)